MRRSVTETSVTFLIRRDDRTTTHGVTRRDPLVATGCLTSRRPEQRTMAIPWEHGQELEPRAAGEAHRIPQLCGFWSSQQRFVSVGE